MTRCRVGIATCALLLCACDGAEPPPPAATSRVQAVVAKAPDADALSGFCDVQGHGGTEPLAWPALADGASVEVSGGPTWVNLWATWCKPCLEELPMIVRWRADWQRAGDAAQVRFVSVDKTQEALRAFAEDHPGTPDSGRMADPDALGEWMRAAGLGEAAGLPIHVFTDAAGRARCVRAGAVVEDHRPLVEHLLR